MKIVRFSDADYALQLEKAVQTSSLFDPLIDERARGIIAMVQARGDEALIELTAKFDGAKLATDQLRVSTAELVTARLGADEDLTSAVSDAHKNIKAFAKRSRRRPWKMRNSHGASVGEKFDPFQRVGIYIPGGTAPLVSTALMTITLAQVAGCPEIVVCTPCGRDGQVNSSLLMAAQVAGATEVYRVGGAQAIAAMALGTPTIGRVQKVFGPGNAYVIAAKRLLFGQVAVDLLPGPSEVCVLADKSANARYVAADLLAQAEHGSGHERVWVITTSQTLLTRVQKEIVRQLPKLHRRDFIQNILTNNTWLILVDSIENGINLVNRLAPEHCEIMTQQPEFISRRILTAGAIFLGEHSPTVVGDYVAGPSHTLPTGGAGNSFAGLTVDQFQRRTSVVQYAPSHLKKALHGIQTFAHREGLDAHGKSAAIRIG